MASSLAYYLVLFLYLHACTARVLQVSSKDHGSNYLHLDKQKFSSVEEVENIGGRKIKYPLTILHHATGSQMSKRSMVESSSKSNAEENVSKDKDNVEDIDVMDYAQPHRKPPIHNKGT